MKLVISQLKEGENLFQFDSTKEPWLQELIKRISDAGNTLLSPMQVNFNLVQSEPDYFLKGKMDFHVEQTCARCAENFDYNVTHPFAISLAHVESKRSHKASDQEEEETDLDINFFEGNEIEIAPILEEQFFLSLPYQSMCSEDCQGICQSCGQNLNQKMCGCSHKNLASPFSVLQHTHI